MKQIPETDDLDSLVVRTDFSDSAAWELICAAIRKPIGEYKAYVDFFSDSEYDGFTPKQLLSRIPEHSDHIFIFIVDHVTISNVEHPILVMDLYDEPGRTFRVIPSAMYSVQNNLCLANMDFEDFAKAVDEDGIFRGFSEG